MSRSTVADSPHEPEARDLLARGWSAARVHAHLVERHGEAGVPSAKALQRYRRSGAVALTPIVPAALIDEAMQRVRTNVNVIDELDHTILLQKRRLVRMALQEEALGETDRELRPSLKVYETCLTRRFNLASSLGLSQRPSSRPGAEAEEETTNEYEDWWMTKEESEDLVRAMRRSIQWNTEEREEMEHELESLKARLEKAEAFLASPNTVRGHEPSPDVSNSGHFADAPEPHEPDHDQLDALDDPPAGPAPELSNDDSENPDVDAETPPEGHDEPTSPHYMVLEGGVAGYVERMRRKRGYWP